MLKKTFQRLVDVYACLCVRVCFKKYFKKLFFTSQKRLEIERLVALIDMFFDWMSHECVRDIVRFFFSFSILLSFCSANTIWNDATFWKNREMILDGWTLNKIVMDNGDEIVAGESFALVISAMNFNWNKKNSKKHSNIFRLTENICAKNPYSFVASFASNNDYYKASFRKKLDATMWGMGWHCDLHSLECNEDSLSSELILIEKYASTGFGGFRQTRKVRPIFIVSFSPKLLAIHFKKW